MKIVLINFILGFSLHSWAWAPEDVELYTEDAVYRDSTNDESYDSEEELPLEEEPVSLHSSRCEVAHGVASWYGPGFDGNRTANGERFDQDELTAAHRTLKFNSIVRVTYHDQSVYVRINDRGPFVRGRVIDLSKAAAEKIGLIAAGRGPVTLEVVSCGPPRRFPRATAI